MTPDAPELRTWLMLAQWDGTAFNGWQAQGEQRTVQGVLTQAVATLVRHPVALFASSRTDAGVHARAMPIAFDSPTTIPARGLLHGVNAHLPDDLALLSVTAAPAGFRPRYHSVAKTYTYHLQLGSRHPLTHRQSWWLRSETLDLPAMRLAAASLLGEHDFSAFRSAQCDAPTTARHLHAITVSDPDHDHRVAITVIGNAFLRHMVRILVGNLVEVGRGRRPPGWIHTVLLSRDRTQGGPTAPASGLTLTEVHFEGYPRLGKRAPALAPESPEPPKVT